MDVNLSAELNRYVSTNYPWLPTRMDFSRIPNHSYLHWGSATDNEVEVFVRSSPLSRFRYVTVLHSAEEPMNVYTLEYAAKEFDRISRGREIFLMFGVREKGQKWCVSKSNLIYAHTGRDIWSTNNKAH